MLLRRADFLQLIAPQFWWLLTNLFPVAVIVGFLGGVASEIGNPCARGALRRSWLLTGWMHSDDERAPSRRDSRRL